jgi:hypothetical protein
VAHANPVVADSNGIFPAIYISPSSGYDLKVILATSADVELYTEDNIPRSNNSLASLAVSGNATIGGALDVTGAASVGALVVESASARIRLNESDAATDKKNWDIFVDGASLSIRTRTDGDAVGKNVFTASRGTTTAISQIDIGNATDVPTVNINGTAVVAANVAQTSSGSFTATLSGFSGSPTATIYYKKTGNIVTLYVTANTGTTSTTTGFGFTGIPAGITPSITQEIACSNLTDNSNGPLMGSAQISTSGACTLRLARTDTYANQVFASSTGFTASGNKLLMANWSVTYSL